MSKECFTASFSLSHNIPEMSFELIFISPLHKGGTDSQRNELSHQSDVKCHPDMFF